MSIDALRERRFERLMAYGKFRNHAGRMTGCVLNRAPLRA